MTVRRLWHWLEEHPPPGPFRPDFWRSPLRGPWLTSLLGAVLLAGIPVLFVTGLLSYVAYVPGLPGNDQTPDAGLLGGDLFAWPAAPAWLYRLNQGVHVAGGLLLVPVVLAKLWSVLPKFFVWPPALSPSQALERLSLVGLVGGGLFTFATGIVNIQYWYVAPTGFYTAHLYGAWIFMGSFAAHAALKLPSMRRGLRQRRLRDELATGVAATVPDRDEGTGLVATRPAAAAFSRRGLLGTVAAGAAMLAGMGAAQNLGGRVRGLALLAPRGQSLGPGPNDFPVNKTAAVRRIDVAATGPSWRLRLDGYRSARLSRSALLELPQHTANLPIACVEGWSTGTQEWDGVRLADLADLAGRPDAASLYVWSLQESGAFGTARLARNQLQHPDALLALRVNGADLSLDHGYPARIVVPAAPGVRNTKWVAGLRFEP